jgi:hypothetical protein
LDFLTAIALFAGQAFTAGAIYGAIRGDIKSANLTAENAHESASDAHKRIDNILMKG